MEKKGEIVIYAIGKSGAKIEVKLEDETVWLNQIQMQELFQQTKQNISLHINNIFKEGELKRKATVKDSLTVQKEGKRLVERKIEYYSLDIIISVGYRVKSKRGTQFRIWANQVLKNYLIKGYVIDQNRFQLQSQQLIELRNMVKLLGDVSKKKELNTEEATGLLKVITDYTYALEVLDQYDHQSLEIGSTTGESIFTIKYGEAIKPLGT